MGSILLAWALAAPGLWFPDVGQGAALVVVEPGGAAIVVDSGPSGGAEAIVARLAHLGISRISLWVHTHFDVDHCGGFSRVIAGMDGRLGTGDDIEVDLLWDRGFRAAPATDAVVVYALLSGSRRIDVSGGAETWVGAARVRSLPVPRGETENARGLAIRIDVAGVSLLAPGDLPAAAVEAAARAGGPVDILWVSHHGSSDGISPAVVELADPAVAVISAGRDNPYCHPAAATLALLADREVVVTQAAGVSPLGPCTPIAAWLGASHRLVGGEVYFPLPGGPGG
jgi:competence protein ComEC